MNFSNFLRQLRTKQSFASVREHYEALGGESKLKMSLRNFQLVESGQRSPSEAVFLSIFRQLPKEEYRSAVQAYFESHCDTAKDVSLLSYLDQHLSPSVTSDNRSLYESEKTVMMYSIEQLDFLAKNVDAMRMHQKLFLWERISPLDLKGKEAIAAKLIELSFADRDADGGLKPSRMIFRVPAYENSPPPSVRAASRYFNSVVKGYFCEEGSSNQTVSFALQLVTPTIAKQIQDQMSAFKRWIQNVASSETTPDLVPFLFMSFGKKIEKREM